MSVSVLHAFLIVISFHLQFQCYVLFFPFSFISVSVYTTGLQTMFNDNLVACCVFSKALWDNSVECVVVQSEPFFRPVDCALLPRYTDYVYHPMDFFTLERVRCCFLINGNIPLWLHCVCDSRLYITACTRGQILTPCGSEALERISMKLGITTSGIWPHMQIRMMLRQRGWSGE